jgi:hypothetical protein
MSSFKLPVVAGLVAATVLAIGSPALAATASQTAKPKMTAKSAAKPAPKLAASKAHPVTVAAKPKPSFFAAAKAKLVAPRAVAARPAANGRMVQARLSNGKVVTYNCSLAGNQTKQVCKR